LTYLLNDSQVEVEIVGQETVESEENSSPAVSGSAVVDLSGLIAGLTEKMGGSGDHSYSTSQNNVFFYVVEGNSMVVRGGPPVAQQVLKNTNSVLLFICSNYLISI